MISLIKTEVANATNRNVGNCISNQLHYRLWSIDVYFRTRKKETISSTTDDGYYFYCIRRVVRVQIVQCRVSAFIFVCRVLKYTRSKRTDVSCRQILSRATVLFWKTFSAPPIDRIYDTRRRVLRILFFRFSKTLFNSPRRVPLRF